MLNTWTMLGWAASTAWMSVVISAYEWYRESLVGKSDAATGAAGIVRRAVSASPASAIDRRGRRSGPGMVVGCWLAVPARNPTLGGPGPYERASVRDLSRRRPGAES